MPRRDAPRSHCAHALHCFLKPNPSWRDATTGLADAYCQSPSWHLCFRTASPPLVFLAHLNLRCQHRIDSTTSMPDDDRDLSEAVECVLPPYPQTRVRSLTLVTVTCYSYVGGLQAFYSLRPGASCSIPYDLSSCHCTGSWKRERPLACLLMASFVHDIDHYRTSALRGLQSFEDRSRAARSNEPHSGIFVVMSSNTQVQTYTTVSPEVLPLFTS